MMVRLTSMYRSLELLFKPIATEWLKRQVGIPTFGYFSIRDITYQAVGS